MDKQEQILQFLRDFDRPYPASYAEIAEGVNVSKNAVRYHIKRLAAQGRIDWLPGGHRTVTLKGD